MKQVIFVLFLFVTQLQAQHHLTLGTGLSMAFYKADGMQNFAETYNFLNQDNLSTLMQNINGSEGMRFEAGYRYIGNRRNVGAVAGFQFFNRKNNAIFNNGESRNLKFKWSSFYTEFEYGRYWKIFMVNGLLALNFKRNMEIESSYLDGLDVSVTKLLNGTYKNESAFSIDPGISISVFRNPFHLSLKVTYPIYVANSSKIFRDKAPEKVAEGIDKFPDDFFKYFDGELYDGLSNEFNGLKFVFTLAYAIPLNTAKSQEKQERK